jgi:DNA gyrase inhibitor GyrI
LKIDIEVTRIEATKTAVLEHREPPQLVHETVSKFIEWREASAHWDL